jgi:hypothetical protein
MRMKGALHWYIEMRSLYSLVIVVKHTYVYIDVWYCTDLAH